MATTLQINVLDEAYLAELEKAAKNRYTDEDDFMKNFNSPQPKPPIQPAEPFRGNRHGGRFRGDRFQGKWQDRRSGEGGRYGGYRDDRRQGYGGTEGRGDRRQEYGGIISN